MSLLDVGHDDTNCSTDARADGERGEEDARRKEGAESHGCEEGFGEGGDEEEDDDGERVGGAVMWFRVSELQQEEEGILTHSQRP